MQDNPGKWNDAKKDEDMLIERRKGEDRRNGKLDVKFQEAVSRGFVVDMRRGERRKMKPAPMDLEKN